MASIISKVLRHILSGDIFSIVQRKSICSIKSKYYTCKYCKNGGKIVVKSPDIKLKIFNRGGSLLIKRQLILESFLGTAGIVSITIGNNASLIFESDFILGQNVKLLVHNGGYLSFGGKLYESGSGITSDTIIMCKDRITIGTDLICSWNVFLTDCDWHKMIINGIQCSPSKPVSIGNHVWIGSNVIITKGSIIEDNAIVGAFSKISNKTVEGNGVNAGIPVQFIKKDVLWQRDM